MLQTIIHNLSEINVDPQTKTLIDSILNILLPILYALAAGGIVLALVRFGFKLHSNPENKAELIRQLIWSLLVFIFSLLNFFSSNSNRQYYPRPLLTYCKLGGLWVF